MAKIQLNSDKQRLEELKITIQELLQKRREAHGDEEEQILINNELNACYEEKYCLLKKLSK